MDNETQRIIIKMNTIHTRGFYCGANCLHIMRNIHVAEGYCRLFRKYLWRYEGTPKRCSDCMAAEAQTKSFEESIKNG